MEVEGRQSKLSVWCAHRLRAASWQATSGLRTTTSLRPIMATLLILWWPQKMLRGRSAGTLCDSALHQIHDVLCATCRITLTMADYSMIL